MKNLFILLFACISMTIMSSCGTDCTNHFQNSAYMSGYNSGKKGDVDMSTAIEYWEAAENADGNHTGLVKEKSSFKAGYNDGTKGKSCKCEGVKASHW